MERIMSYIATATNKHFYYLDVRIEDIDIQDIATKLLETGEVELISLDHDLGNDERGTGYDVLLWIEEQVYLNEFKAPEIIVHSSNSSARHKMELAIENIKKVE